MKKDTPTIIQPEGNSYNKYDTKNIIEKLLMNNFFKAVLSCLDTAMVYKKVGGVRKGCIKILDAGCGEARLTEIIYKHLIKNGVAVEIDAFDISERIIKENAKKYQFINFSSYNIYDFSIDKKYDIIICSEVCEHLEHPQRALNDLLKYADDFIISVPREPIWRILNMAHLKYVKSFGNSPGHVQHWSKKGFAKVVKESGLEIMKCKSPLPWTVVWGHKRNGADKK